MDEYSELFIGLDTSKAKISVAVAEKERNGEVRFFGDISAEPTSVASMVAKLAKRGAKLHFCYEAGPTGYDLYRQIIALGHECQVVAPSLIYVLDAASFLISRRGRRTKTDRIDVEAMTFTLRAYLAGDPSVCRVVPVPTPEAEDAKRISRERTRLASERTRHVNRIRWTCNGFAPVT